ncbi:MAG TPA: ATP-binding protein [Candidatus Brocadiia bacterium]|nr:PAS domain S-box protein [Planctomycetota bacterium]MDO8094567.1 ATP-binding protein [Candidatus Brocadiales bacterium]
MANNKKIFGGIGRKILICFLIIAITPAAVLTFISYWNSKKLIEKQLSLLLDDTVEMVSKEIDSFMRSKKSMVAAFSADGLIREGLAEINSGASDKEEIVEHINKHLSINKVPLDSDIIEAFVIDLHGRVVASSNEARLDMDASDEDYFVEGWRHGIYVSDLHYDEHANINEPIIYMSRVITNLKEAVPTGMIVITVRGSALSRATTIWNGAKGENVHRIRDMGRTGEVFIVNEDGLMITESRFIENVVLKQVLDTDPVRRAFSIGEGMSGIYPDYRGVEVHGTSILLHDMGWLVIAKKDVSEIFEPINGLRNISISLTTGVALIIVIIVFFVTRGLTNPIHKLVAATEKVAQGDLNAHITTAHKDEIGLLSNSFNTMVQNLKKSRGELRALFDDGVDAMFVLSAGENIADVNKSACDLLGRERNDIIGTNISKLIGHDGATDSEEYPLTEARQLVTEVINKTWTLKTGEKYPVIDVSLTTKDREEALCELELKRTDYGVFAVFHDITEKKHLEQDIINEKQRLDNIVTQIGAGISLVDRDMKVVWMNEMQFRWFGDPNDILGRKCYSAYWKKKEVCQGCPAKETFETGTINKALHTYTTPDGKQKWYNIISSPLKDRKGRITHVMNLVEDITEEKQAEEEFKRLHKSVIQANICLEQSYKELKLKQEQLIRSEKLASMGQLAASVAHEIKNPLSSISLNIELLFDELKSYDDVTKKEATKILETITKEVDRLTEVSEAYLKFARLPNLSRKARSINDILLELVGFLREEISRENIILTEYYEKDLPIVDIDENQMKQAFLNIFKNAFEAMPNGGKLSVSTRRGHNGHVEVRISDTGMGISKEDFEKIFDPFYTTKNMGTGLGLTVSQQIIREHGGEIYCQSVPRGGTTFTIQLPKG